MPGSRQVIPDRLTFCTLAQSSAGHYAGKAWSLPTSSNMPPRPKLLSAADHNKDQSYYLSSITEQGLGRALFPLQNLTKPQVRELAKKHHLPTAERAESMGLCFVGEKGQFDQFLCMLPSLSLSVALTSFVLSPSIIPTTQSWLDHRSHDQSRNRKACRTVDVHDRRKG